MIATQKSAKKNIHMMFSYISSEMLDGWNKFISQIKETVTLIKY
jgi:hypothetical protein